jgi:hypothetical protein
MFVALVSLHEKRMRRIVLWNVSRLAVQYFSMLSYKRHQLRKKKTVIEHQMYVLIFSTTFL